jgi:glycosyltransferase involved in cell wall biosynthesis
MLPNLVTRSTLPTVCRRKVPLTVKILVVHNRYQHAGGEDVVVEQECNMLRSAGHEVVTYFRTNDEIKDFSRLQRLALIPQTIWASGARTEFKALLEREKPGIVHVHNTFIMISPSIFSACEEAGIPVAHTLHNYRLMCPTALFFRDGHVCEECVDSLWSGIRHGCYHESSAATAVVAGMIAVHRRLNTWSQPTHFYIALSQFARQKFVDAGLPEDRIFVKPNFVHPDPGRPGDKDDYAVFAGRLSEEKRVDNLLQAWERSKSRFPVLILGDGPERPGLEEMARQKNLSGIDFKGRVPREQVIETIRKARFLIFSSEVYENFPVSIVEAFACGTPVICSRMGAMQEIVSDGSTGLHFTPGQVDDLAGKMDWAWSHPDRMNEMGRQARREYETKYTAETNYKLLMDIYNQAMASTRRQ